MSEKKTRHLRFPYNLEPRTSNLSAQRGFTLVEMIVAVALFTVVMLISVGALLALTSANRKAQALQSVMNNLNITLDGMTRNIRMGTKYHCGAGTFAGDGTDDCPLGNTSFTFSCNPANCSGGTWTYAYDADGSICGVPNGICKRENSGSYVALTAPEVSINTMTFYVVGTKPGDAVQPKVLIVTKGTAGGGSAKTKTTFHIQATAVQRELDLHQTP